jgi:hypothetical protein
MSMESDGGMILTGETPDSSTSALWQFYQNSHLVANYQKHGEGNAEFCLRRIPFTLLEFFSML